MRLAFFSPTSASSCKMAWLERRDISEEMVQKLFRRGQLVAVELGDSGAGCVLPGNQDVEVTIVVEIALAKRTQLRVEG